MLADPEHAPAAKRLRPDALVDAILAKRNLGMRIGDAPVVIGVGPGFIGGGGLPRRRRDDARATRSDG